MPKITKDYYQISVTLLVEKSEMDFEMGKEGWQSKEEFVCDRLQRGMEIPIEKVEAVVIL